MIAARWGAAALLSLAVAACRRYPSLRAAIFDLPATIEVAGEFIARSGFKDRIELIPGDFFRDPLPQADLYSVGRILHEVAAYTAADRLSLQLSSDRHRKRRMHRGD